ncbi:MAG: VanZ family protein [Haloarculaceae archaeon]
MSALPDRWVDYALVVGFAAAVLLASVVDPPTGTGAAGAAVTVPRALGLPLDKWVHAGTYAVLAGLLCRATNARAAWVVLLAAGVAVSYGAAIEVVQATLPARSFEVGDLAANAVGATLMGVAWRVRPALVDRAVLVGR